MFRESWKTVKHLINLEIIIAENVTKLLLAPPRGNFEGGIGKIL